MIEELRELFAYTTWANGRILDAVARLEPAAFDRDLGSSFPSIRATLAHLVGADWVWLERWHGRSPTGMPGSWDLSTPEAIRVRWGEIERARGEYVAGLSDADLQRRLEYRNTKGQPYAGSLGETLRHVVNHSTYHRGQVVTMLRQLGAEGVNTDLITFYRQRAADAPAAGD